jgi:TfoX/Sxy family transcriptional regulator of competence genes
VYFQITIGNEKAQAGRFERCLSAIIINMRTPKEQAQSLLAQVQQVADARIRPMMGEYILYVDDKVIGQINHSVLFVKVTPFGEEFANDLVRESPYDGAKPAFIVPQSKIDDVAWLQSFIAGTVKEL